MAKKKIMLINWKFNDCKNSFNKYKIVTQKECLVYTSNYNNKVERYKEKIKGIINENKNSNFLFLLHESENNNINCSHLDGYTEYIKKYSFSGGANEGHRIYYDGELKYKGLLGTGNYIHDETLEDGKIKKENFEFVWNYYWNILDLEFQKKKLIDTFLPLAIDAKGLQEVMEKKDEQYLEDYLKDVTKDIKNNEKNISKNWNEIKEVFGLKITDGEELKETLPESYRLTKEEKESFYLPFENKNKPGFNENILREYFQKFNNWQENEFLPNWLNNVIQIIEKKI